MGIGFNVLGRTIPYYGFFIVLGVGTGAALGLLQCKKHKLSYGDFITLACFGALGGILGSKLLYLIVSFKDIDPGRLSDPAYLQMLFGGGFVFYGGLIGGIAALFAGAHIFKIELWPYVTAGIPCLPLAHAFGRMGCFMVGCCYGAPYSGPLCVTYTSSPFAPRNIGLFPVQAAEALCDLVITAILLYSSNRPLRLRSHCLWLYVLLYASVRFILEFFRYDDNERGVWLMFSTSQWISLAMLLFSVIYYILKIHKIPKDLTGNS